MQEPEYIEMLRQMTTDQFRELTTAIGRECSLRDTTTQDYCDLASLFAGIAVGLHERGGCYVMFQLQHPTWDSVHLYETGEGFMTVPLTDPDDEEERDL